MRWALALASALAALLLVELGFRIAGYGSPVSSEDLLMSWEPECPLRRDADPGLKTSLEPNFRGAQVYRRVADGVQVHVAQVRTSSLGLRGPELQSQAPAGTLRVLGLGDSVGFGQGVSEEQTMLAVMARVLSARRPVQAVNAAVPGWNLAQQTRWLQLHGAELHPDLVLQLFYINDFAEAPPDPDEPTVEKLAPPWARREAGLRRFSHLYNQYCRVREREKLAAELLQPPPEQGRGWNYLDELRQGLDAERAREGFDALQRACQGLGVPCVVAVLPCFVPAPGDDGQDILDIAAQGATSAGLRTLRLERSLDGLEVYRRYVLPGDNHPGPAAHQELGEALAALLEGKLEP